MTLTSKILVSAPSDEKLNTRQLAIKEAVRRAIKRGGFELQEFGKSGIPRRMAWSFDNVQKTLRQCQGIAVLGLNIGTYSYLSGDIVRGISEYNHVEGTLGLAQFLPALIISEESNSPRGILWSAGARYSVIPSTSNSRWVLSKPFKTDFEAWSEEVNNRPHVFLGYNSTGAETTAAAVKNYLRTLGVRVLDWMNNFPGGGTIMDEIQHAERLTMGGIFLFTKDDTIEVGGQQKEIPRDNVIFEAGYFMNTKGKERTLLICEDGVKILNDVGGNIYLGLQDRHDISSIKPGLEQFIKARF